MAPRPSRFPPRVTLPPFIPPAPLSSPLSPSLSSLRSYLNKTSAAGGTYVTGTLLDRLAPEGRLAPIAAAPSLPAQFPLGCRVVKKLYEGWDFKVVAFKVRAGHAGDGGG